MLQEGERMNNIIEYSSEINNLTLGKFKAKELDILFSIISKLTNQSANEVVISFQELKELASYSNRNLDRFIKDLEGTYKKILGITYRTESERYITNLVIFTKYEIDKKEKSVKIKVNKEAEALFNEFDTFTKLDLKEFANLKSSYSRNVFRLLKQFDNQNYKECWYQVSLQGFKMLMDIPNIYKMGSIDQKVLSPVLEELKPLFPSLKLEKIKRGVKVDSLKFTWKPKKKQAEEVKAIKKRNSIGEKELEEHNKQFEEVQEEKKEVDPVEKIEKIKISKAEYEELYKKYLEENKIIDTPGVKKIFGIMNKIKYEVIEFQQPNFKQTKIYTVEDIEPSLLLSKTGKKLSGSILANRINKILEDMNKNGSV